MGRGGKKINLIGASNHLTNSTCVFGNMAGLAPTATVRPHVTGIHGYKHLRVAANGFIWETNTLLPYTMGDKNAGCGLGRFETNGCTNSINCIKHINPRNSTAGAYYKGSRGHLG